MGSNLAKLVSPPPNILDSSLLPFPFWASPHAGPRKIRPFLFMHLRGTHFASPLFSNSCMEWGVYPPPSKKEQLMNTTTVSSSSIPDPIAVPPKTPTSRCPYLYPNGKRCSLPGLPVHSGFCLRHSQAIAPTAIPVPVYNDSEDLSADLLPDLSEFNSGVDINNFLARLLTLVTKGSISPRRPSVLASITNQLLHSPPPIAPQTNPGDD